jgi:hypothetical protein
MWIIIPLIIIIGLVGTIILIVGCKNPSNTNTPNSPTQTHQPSPTSSITPTPASSQTTKPSPTTTSPPITNSSTSSTPISSPTFSLTSTPTPKSNVVIDHNNWDWYFNQSSDLPEKVAQLKIFFSHASVGANILQGLKDLNTASATKYPLAQVAVKGIPPSTTAKGVLYEYPRGNPNWAEKVTSFKSYIDNGWQSPTVQIVLNKFCYIDQSANLQTYIDSMVALEAKYPTTVFVYWTMPLMTSGDTDAVLRSQFNQGLRNWLSTQNNKVLFDIADIEAWSPDVKMQSFTNKDVIHQKLYTGYSSDGGHLNEAGMNRMASAFYSLLGKTCVTFPDRALPK